MSTVLPPLVDFATWLADRPADAVVGWRITSRECPLSAWLQDHFGTLVLVDEQSIEVQHTTDSWHGFLTPPDYRLFIEAIDYAWQTPHREVQVGEVRSVLKQLTSEQDESHGAC